MTEAILRIGTFGEGHVEIVTTPKLAADAARRIAQMISPDRASTPDEFHVSWGFPRHGLSNPNGHWVEVQLKDAT